MNGDESPFYFDRELHGTLIVFTYELLIKNLSVMISVQKIIFDIACHKN